ncbi:DUF6802 family protein [Gordonia malaquae]|uniref:DUF6802 family protein n=1 Tax=Gordonia malaquae TaxID=410332 RepID=UPI0030FE96EB
MEDWFVSGSGDAPVGPADSLWTYEDGSLWDLGPADFDADGDGTPESRASELDGDQVLLSDTDGDGRVDRVTTLHTDGTVDVADVTAERRLWSPTSLGRLE